MKLLKNINIEVEKGTSLWSNSWYRLKQNRLAIIGLVVLIIMIIISLLTPWIAPYSYEAQDLYLGATPPSAEHWLGTDGFGRDMLTRIMYGSRVSLAVGFLATAVSLIIGVTWGTISGFSGGRVDSIMMRIVDILYALPFIIFVILLMVVFGRNLFLLFMAIGAVEWLTMARIIRGQVLSIREKEYIDAAIMTGVSGWRIITRHVIPNTIGPIIVYTTLTIPSVILLESFLSFLGLGIQPPMCSWGLLINYGVETMEEYPWLLIFPGAVLSITLFSLNFLGDGLRDALDPKSSRK
jgi:oligopeptide transport system permease protein